jgi:uncharacterized protein
MSRAESMDMPAVKSPATKALLLTVVGFVLLDVYSYLPAVLSGGPGLFVAVGVSFFFLAHAWGRLSGAGGLRGYGFFRHSGWGRNLALGFAAGFAFKGLAYGLEWALGGFRFEGFIDLEPLAVLLAQALFGMFLSSAMDDVLLRGYLFRHLSPFLSSRALIFVTTALYILNHALYARMTLLNCALWAALGLAFALALARTGSLWLAIGLHWGGNVMYRVRNGFDPQQGGMVRLTELSQPEWFGWLGVGSMVLMLAATFLLVRVAAKAEPVTGSPSPGNRGARLSPAAGPSRPRCG